MVDAIAPVGLVAGEAAVEAATAAAAVAVLVAPEVAVVVAAAVAVAAAVVERAALAAAAPEVVVVVEMVGYRDSYWDRCSLPSYLLEVAYAVEAAVDKFHDHPAVGAAVVAAAADDGPVVARDDSDFDEDAIGAASKAVDDGTEEADCSLVHRLPGSSMVAVRRSYYDYSAAVQLPVGIGGDRTAVNAAADAEIPFHYFLLPIDSVEAATVAGAVAVEEDSEPDQELASANSALLEVVPCSAADTATVGGAADGGFRCLPAREHPSPTHWSVLPCQPGVLPAVTVQSPAGERSAVASASVPLRSGRS